MIRFLEVAQQELDEAVVFHEAQAQGLGQSFLAEALAALELVCAAIRKLGIQSAPAPDVAVCAGFLTESFIMPASRTSLL